MKSQLYCLLALIILIMAPLAATGATANYNGSCTIIFEAQTTMKNFSGTAACEPFEITTTDDLVRVPVVAVEVATIDTGNNKRDRDMRKMLEDETFPLITGNNVSFASDRFFTPEGNLVEMPEELTFALTIRDVTQTITATVTQPRIDSSTIAATLIFDLSLSSFELNPPSFLGIIRVKDTIKVRVAMSLDRKPASTNTPPAQE